MSIIDPAMQALQGMLPSNATTPMQPMTVNGGLVKGSASEEEVRKYAESQFSICKNARLQFERQWYLNIAFYFGRQYANWVGDSMQTARLMTPGAPSWRVRLVSNQVRKYVRKEFAKATQEQPTGFVLPQSGDDSDLMAAKAGDAIIEYLLRETNFEVKKKRAIFWAHLCGTSFIKDWYDKADPNMDSVDDMPNSTGVTPFHLWVPDIIEEDLEGQPYLFYGVSKDVHWVNNTYQSEIAAQGNNNSGMVEEKFLSAMGVSEKSDKNQVFIKEGWFKPGGKFKEGAVIHWTDNQVLYFQEGWPYAHGEFPFSKIDHIPTGRFYSESMVTDLIPLQKEYNRTRSQIIEAKNRMAKPQLVAPVGSVDVNKMTSEPGQVIFYRVGYDPPKPLDLQSLPSYVIQELDRNRADMDDVSSQHEVSRGQAPPGVEAATAISYLQEQDDSVLSNLITSIEKASEKTARHFLHFVNQHWDMDRKIQVVGLNQQLEAFEFSKANLNGNVDYVVQSGSATPRSQAAKQAFILDMMKNGYIQPTQGMKYLSMSETGKLYEELQVDSRQAQRENLKMNQGQQITVNTWDQHLIHMLEHDNWRKRQEYETSPPETKILFEEHDRMHKSMLIMLYGYVPPEDPIQLNSMVFKIQNGIPLAPEMPPQEGMGGENVAAGPPQ